jgi:hypothetical protein
LGAAATASQINAVDQVAVVVMMARLVMGLGVLAGLILALPTKIHRVILTLGEAVVPGAVVSDDGAVGGRGEVVRDAADDDAIGPRGSAIVAASVPLDGEFQIRFLRVREVEVLIVVVGVRVFVAAQGLALRGEREGFFRGVLDVGACITGALLSRSPTPSSTEGCWGNVSFVLVPFSFFVLA